MEYLSPKLDIVFKKMFSDKNNTDMLKGLLRAYLDIDVEGTYHTEQYRDNSGGA